MIIGIVGMGLIGGSLAKAYSEKGHTVYGFDSDEAILGFAQLSGAIKETLDEQSIKECELLLISVNPADAIVWLEQNAANIGGQSCDLPDFKNTIVIDCCGVKRTVCQQGFALAEKHGFIFVGGHPMAGSHNSGFKNSRASLFKGASMLIIPPIYDNPDLFGRIEELLNPIGFGRLTITTADKHDEMIAFSSQMPHVVSNAFIKSPTARSHKGFSAGSYKDLTRVARLNADMWAQLCMDNNDYLIDELDGFINAIAQYRDALAEKNVSNLKALLEEGSRIKGELDR